jgi:hypothetical protein
VSLRFRPEGNPPASQWCNIRVAQGGSFGFSQLRVPQRPLLVPAQFRLLPRPLRCRQQSAHRHQITAHTFRLFGQQLFNGLINLDAPLGKAFANFFRNALDLKVTARLVANFITEPAQFAGKFMVIDVFGEFSRPQQLIILQSLPAIFSGIKSCVENNAMRVQMRV